MILTSHRLGPEGIMRRIRLDSVEAAHSDPPADETGQETGDATAKE